MIRLSKAQDEIFGNPARFKVVVAGRRFGKTVLALCTLLHSSWEKAGSINWYTAPTYRQAKQIAWSMLRGFLPPEAVASRNETDLSLTLINGSIIALRGADNYDSLRGVGLDALVLDEYADMAADRFKELRRHGFVGPRAHDGKVKCRVVVHPKDKKAKKPLDLCSLCERACDRKDWRGVFRVRNGREVGKCWE